MAVGLGVYGGLSSGNSDWTAEDDYGRTWDCERDSGHTEAGLVLDTTVAKDRLFNYRLNLGYQKLGFEKGNSKLEMEGFVMRHVFGFGVLRNKDVRLWLGPQLSFSWSSGGYEGVSNFDVNLFGVGIAPVIGVNFNLGPVVTLALDGGYWFTKYFGTGESTSTYYDRDYSVSEQTPFVNFSLIFRIGDKY